jgi:hypothetical protein
LPKNKSSNHFSPIEYFAPQNIFFPFWGLTGKDFVSANQSTAGKSLSAARKNFFYILFSEKKFLFTVDGLEETKYNSSSPRKERKN